MPLINMAFRQKFSNVKDLKENDNDNDLEKKMKMEMKATTKSNDSISDPSKESSSNSLKDLPDNFSMPAEWTPHQSVWLAWPYDESIWLENLKPAQEEFVAFCHAIVDLDPKTKQPRGETIDLMVFDEATKAKAQKALHGLPINFHVFPYGDIWLRDTAPLFLKNQSHQGRILRFEFNGWGEKYIMDHDDKVSQNILQVVASQPGFGQWAQATQEKTDWICEGGSLEFDGLGTCLTTKQCLLNRNRNPNLSASQIEAKAKKSLGVNKILWLGDGLLNDHTDGHIDTVARFASPGVVLCMKASEQTDPNYQALNQIEMDLNQMKDGQDRKLTVGLIPSPGKVLNSSGEIMPASYLNFYISNTKVIVPTYGSPYDQRAVAAIAKYFPDRQTLGLSAKAILSGGGAFHCISQQVPVI